MTDMNDEIRRIAALPPEEYVREVISRFVSATDYEIDDLAATYVFGNYNMLRFFSNLRQLP